MDMTGGCGVEKVVGKGRGREVAAGAEPPYKNSICPLITRKRVGRLSLNYQSSSWAPEGGFRRKTEGLWLGGQKIYTSGCRGADGRTKPLVSLYAAFSSMSICNAINAIKKLSLQ